MSDSDESLPCNVELASQSAVNTLISANYTLVVDKFIPRVTFSHMSNSNELLFKKEFAASHFTKKRRRMSLLNSDIFCDNCQITICVIIGNIHDQILF